MVLTHHRVGVVAASQPERATVEGFERVAPGCHVLEAADPDKTVRRALHRELPERVHACRPLRDQELLLEVAEELASRSLGEQVVAQLETRLRPRTHGRAERRVKSITQCRPHVTPPSSER